MKLPGPDHPITIQRNPKRVVIRFNERNVADTTHAWTLQEAKYPPVLYVPRADVDMKLFTKTAHSTHCPYKGDASYFSVNVDGRAGENVAWSYEQPFEAVGSIKDHLAFYPDRVEAIEER
jgi:uncharacterized protein (DUF427 family)